VTSFASIGIGIMLLAVSLATGDTLLLNWGAFLAGSILVIVGTGRMFFLEK
jgi:hypothetical protein